MLFAQTVPESNIDPEEVVPSGVDWGDWIEAGVILVVAVALAIVVHRLLVRTIARRSERRAHLARLVGRFSAMAIFAGGLVYALSALGVQIGPVLGALGIVGLALAFALQDVLKNLVAGIILQASSPFRPGDQIRVKDWEGTVEDVDFRTVVIRTFVDTRVVLPSAMVASEPIENLTALGHRLTAVRVEVAYGTDLHVAEDVITNAVRRVDGVEAYPPAVARLEAFEESGIKFAVVFWHDSRNAAMWAVRHAVIHGVNDALGEAGITIPFPQRRVWFAPTDDALGDGSSPE